MALSTTTIGNAIAAMLGVLIIGTTLLLLFFVSFFYLGQASDMSFNLVVMNIAFRLVVMSFISLIMHALMIGLSKLFSKNKLLGKLSSRKVFYALIGLSVLMVFLVWI